MIAGQIRHESPDVGDAIVRMMRGLVARAADGDTEAIEQLARINELSSDALSIGVALTPYTLGELVPVMGVTRARVQQRRKAGQAALVGPGHVLRPGHTKRGCDECKRKAAR